MQQAQIPSVDEIPLYVGKKTKITLPSSKQITIRERNGDDDDIISDQQLGKDGTNIFAFVAAITEIDHDLNRKPTVAEIKQWPTNDVYAVLLKQYIANFGKDMKFTHLCQNEDCGHEAKYSEDLSLVDGDMEDPNYKPKNSLALRKYPNGKTLEILFKTSSGKELKYKILNYELAKKELEEVGATKNSPLKFRELQIKNKDSWVDVKHFGMFSPKDMVEIRQNVRDNDPLFQPNVNFSCAKCQMPYSVVLWQLGAFYYPEEI